MTQTLPPTAPLGGTHLILGGARSGKSRFAENIINQAGGGTYIATGRAWDDEMANRIDLHKQSRGDLWQTVEEPLELCSALLTCNVTGGKPVLVDCLTLWLTNLMLEDRDIDEAIKALCDLLPTLVVPVLFVSNEVGFGIVPENAMARAFRDHAGRLHQRIAEQADKVTLVVAGIPMQVK
jgi:adenosylcobinamide kinase/adenosylcobinamide-phosphate guanylyltransferase